MSTKEDVDAQIEAARKAGFPICDPGAFTQVIPPIILPEPKPFYGLTRLEWLDMADEERTQAQETYYESVEALKEIYARLLEPIAVVNRK